MVETILNDNWSFQSGSQWAHDNLLKHRKVIAVAGTHGKTTTSAMLAWILHQADAKPGFLIGGQPGNFSESAEYGEGKWFVIEADEYDTAFFDKRSKFVHYNPTTAILNNLEFDHADIFENLEQIKTQFHHLVRIVPANGFLVVNEDDENLKDVLAMGYWSNVIRFSTQEKNCEWSAEKITADYSSFKILNNGKLIGEVTWPLIGLHNMQNALAAVAAASTAGIDLNSAINSFGSFVPTARRLQMLFSKNNVHLYEDFAHHPTAISLTIDALKQKHPQHKIIAVVEPRSNTMKSGAHREKLGSSFNGAEKTLIYQTGELDWVPQELKSLSNIQVYDNKEELISTLDLRNAENNGMICQNTVIVCMSNGSFDGIPQTIFEMLNTT